MSHSRKVRETIKIKGKDRRKPRIPLPVQTEKVMTPPSERRKSSVPKKDRWKDHCEGEDDE